MINRTKKKIATVRLTLMTGNVTPSPTLGQALGQYGINIINFCKTFNEKTKNIKELVPIPARIEIYKLYGQTSIEVIIKSPSNTYLLKQAAGIKKGSSNPGQNGLLEKGDVPYITLKEIYHLALFKARGLSPNSAESLCKIFIGSAKSIGLSLRPAPRSGVSGT